MSDDSFVGRSYLPSDFAYCMMGYGDRDVTGNRQPGDSPVHIGAAGQERFPIRDGDENPLGPTSHQGDHQPSGHAQNVMSKGLVAREWKDHFMEHNPNRFRPAAEPPAKRNIHPFAAKGMRHILDQQATGFGQSAQKPV
jgi:hypothetical protein